jgi:hypothetical protein
MRMLRRWTREDWNVEDWNLAAAETKERFGGFVVSWKDCGKIDSSEVQIRDCVLQTLEGRARR